MASPRRSPASISSNGWCGKRRANAAARSGADRADAARRSRSALYAEDPARDFRPSSGTLTDVALAADARVETWVESGTEVSPFYDPMLAKIIVDGRHASDALAQASGGARRNAHRRASRPISIICASSSRSTVFARGEMLTRTLQTFAYKADTIEVLSPARRRPSRIGPDASATGLSACRPRGRWIRCRSASPTGSSATTKARPGSRPRSRGRRSSSTPTRVICLAGAELAATLDGAPVPYWQAVRIKAGQMLKLGGVRDRGVRAYIAVRGGIDVPNYLGSTSTFTLGKFGGHGGRVALTGDVLHIGRRGRRRERCSTRSRRAHAAPRP